MLGHVARKNGAVARKLGYDPEDALSQEAVKAYVAEDYSLVEAPIDQFGMEISMFDKAIDNINHTSHTLALELQNATD